MLEAYSAKNRIGEAVSASACWIYLASFPTSIITDMRPERVLLVKNFSRHWPLRRGRKGRMLPAFDPSEHRREAICIVKATLRVRRGSASLVCIVSSTVLLPLRHLILDDNIRETMFTTSLKSGLICMLWMGSDNAYSHAALIVSSWLTAQSLTSTDVTRHICLPHKETGN
jgi:hypothetical protein